MTPDNQFYGGTIADFADSMAEEIEVALNAVRVENGKELLPTEDVEDRRMLFIAIARGVINHLSKHRRALAMTVAAAPLPQTVNPTVGVRAPGA